MTFTQLLALVTGSGQRIHVCSDSRYVMPGDVFVAVPGTHVDGHHFIAQAIQNGAEYIVCQKNVD